MPSVGEYLISAEEIARRYTAGEGAPSIARAAGVTHATVYAVLDRAGIPRRPRKNAGDASFATSVSLDGDSLAMLDELCVRLGTEQKQLTRSEVIRRAVALLYSEETGKKRGHK